MDCDAKWFKDKDRLGHWTKSLQCIPEKFCLESIRRYLIDSTEKTFDKDAVRAFKSLKAYKYFQEGYVQRIYTQRDASTKLTISKAEVMASMERRVYQVFVCLDDAGKVLGGSCKCVAG